MNLAWIQFYCIIALILGVFSTITFCIPKHYFGLYISWIAAIFSLLYIEISQVTEKLPRHLGYLWSSVFLICFGFIMLLRLSFINFGIGLNIVDYTSADKSNLFKVAKYGTFLAYGLILARFMI